jgi:hypothetical protein
MPLVLAAGVVRAAIHILDGLYLTGGQAACFAKSINIGFCENLSRQQRIVNHTIPDSV